MRLVRRKRKGADMEPLQQVRWQGASGESYLFDVYTLEHGITPGVSGIFIIARTNPEGWDAVYIGQGELKPEVENRIADSNVMDKLPTHIHVHRNGAESARRAAAADLLAGHTEAYEPHGCNVRF
jgi:hypothetical protein